VSPPSAVEKRRLRFEAERRARRRWTEFLDWVQQHQTARWVFRGEPECRTQLRPAVGRRTAEWDEGREILLYQTFQRRSRLFRPSAAELSFVETIAWAQHHGLPTRLLDWTTNPLAAAYFAMQRAGGKAVVVHAVDAAEIGFWSDDLTRDWGPEDIAALSKTRFVEIAPLSPRIAAQRGLFSLHHKPNVNWKPKGWSQEDSCFEVQPGETQHFLQRLHQLGIDASTIMTDLDGLCASLKWWYQSGLQTPSTIGRRLRLRTSRGSTK
jgi:hypothetical protein